MISDRKPDPKRHLGPAMQWAKPRSITDRAANANTKKIDIKVDLTSELEDDTVATHTPDTSRQRQDSSSSPKVKRTQWGSTAGQVSHTPGFDETFEPAKQWPPGTPSEQRSAWDYYSATAADGDVGLPQDPGHGATYDDRGSQYEDYEYDPYFGDMTPQQSPQHNRSSWDGAPTGDDQSDQGSWVQYIWPFIVVAFIVFLAFLTLVT